ncbi:hypothetical protein HanPI659440_Chr10g0391341 [Helianthus annuus]|nr:hypothetical protein HanPI659440_Chr10g0391341 [Helianthus annuus]
MGCSSSKLDDEEAVQLCKDRKNFIKKAVEHRTKFASGHKAYLQSLKRVSAALKDYVEGDEPREFSLNSFTTPPLPPSKKTTPRFITISPNSFTIEQPKVHYLRSGGNASVFVEEMPPESPEIARVESYNQSYNHSPVYQYAADSFFGMQSPMHPHSHSQSQASIFGYNRPNLPPPSPQRSSQWDFFFNPFSSLDYYGYNNRNSVFDDDVNGLQQVREEEGIPELEEETEQEEIEHFSHRRNRGSNGFNGHVNCDHEDEVSVVDDHDDDEDDDDDAFETDSGEETVSEHELEPRPTVTKTQNLEVSKGESSGKVVNTGNGDGVMNQEKGKTEGTPGFTVYVNRRPTSMSEVIKDLEAQFQIISDSANELSVMLDANRAQYSSTSHELSAMKMLNPVALLRSASSSRSNSSRFLVNSSKEEGYASSSDQSDDSCMFHNSHQTTLDKLYAWEKKLYEEVKAGERIRIAYDKKCAQLRNHDAKGDDHSSVHKTRTAIRDLHTQIKVSIHSVEAVSKRIETLRDQELQPQLLELIQGLSRMWKVMAECHQTQKRTLDEAKILLAGTPSRPKKYTPLHPNEPHRLAQSASNLEFELQNWKACFETWITSQKSYIHAITGWLLQFAVCSAQGYADLIKQWESATCPGSSGGPKM